MEHVFLAKILSLSLLRLEIYVLGSVLGRPGIKASCSAVWTALSVPAKFASSPTGHVFGFTVLALRLDLFPSIYESRTGIFSVG